MHFGSRRSHVADICCFSIFEPWHGCNDLLPFYFEQGRDQSGPFISNYRIQHEANYISRKKWPHFRRKGEQHRSDVSGKQDEEGTTCLNQSQYRITSTA